jgi:hypothetical protein
VTDDEWTHIERFIPPAKRGGNRRHVNVREVMNGIKAADAVAKGMAEGELTPDDGMKG